MRPDQIGDFAVFAAIASDRSFTRAARRLEVTQSALSQTEDTNADARWLAGVIIRETDADENGNRNFIAHGMLTIYGQVWDTIGAAFPDAQWPEPPSPDSV
jgi:hypothetical protein